MSPFDDALAVVRGAFGKPVIYTGAGLDEEPLQAIKSDVAADAFQGSGATARRISFEVAQDDLPQHPGKSDTILHDGVTWRVNDITRRDDVGAWELVVVRQA